MTERTGRKKQNTGAPRWLLAAGIALIAVLLLLVFCRQAAVRKQEESAAVSIEESAAKAEAERRAQEEASRAAEESASHVLLPCQEEEISELIHRYFSLRLAADTDGLAALFGRTEPLGEDIGKMLSAQSSRVRSFDDVEILMIPCADENERAGLVKFRINFRRVNTKAPGLMMFYARKTDDGTWLLLENPTAETREGLQREMELCGVQQLMEENTAELRKALENDSDLALVYTSFLNGEIYSEVNLDPEREQVVDLFLNPEDSVLIGQENGTEGF